MNNKIVSPLVVGLFYTNISQSPCLVDGRSNQLDPYTPSNDDQIFSHLINPPNKPNLNWSWFIWSTTLLIILALGVFLSWLSFLASCNYDSNQNSKYILNTKKLLDPFYFTCWLVLTMHALIITTT